MTWEDWINTVQLGDCLKLMKEMPEGVVHTTVTSIPYYGLRDYGISPTKWPAVDYSPMPGLPAIHIPEMECCYGLEPTVEAYVGHGVLVFREVKRIMHPTGTLWLNMGDSYASQGGPLKYDINEILGGPPEKQDYQKSRKGIPGLKPKDLLEMPSRLVLALQKDGWWLRCRIPWLKRNAMPESVQGSRWERHRIKVKKGEERTQKFGAAGLGFRDHSGLEIKGAAEYVDCPGCSKCDPNDGLVLRMSAGRPTQAVEYVFLLTKSPECYYDGEAVRVPAARIDTQTFGGAKARRNKIKKGDPRYRGGHEQWGRTVTTGEGGRSRRNSDWFFESWQGLWTDENGEPLAFIVNPKPYKRAHFATFPPGLVIPCIRAGTSERGACPECGSPWVRVVQPSGSYAKILEKNRGSYHPETQKELSRGLATAWGKVKTTEQVNVVAEYQTLDWRPTCSCGHKETVPCLVCDIFAGTGTVIEVARKMGRSGLGFEISEEYVKEYCAERLAQGVLGLKTEGK